MGNTLPLCYQTSLGGAHSMSISNRLVHEGYFSHRSCSESGKNAGV